MRPGNLLDSRYTLIRLIGEGGFGAVWEARDARMHRTVALKITKPGTRPSDAERFTLEALTAGSLNHPHIVTVHDCNTTQHEGRSLPYLVMELIDGEPLDAVLARGLPPLGQALFWAEQICDALAAAHHHGVVHRDIKPANVLVQADGVVKLVDFGIATSLMDHSQLSTTGDLIGTFAYMAPERFSRESADPRCDLYAVGCLLAEVCTGDTPFPGPYPHNYLYQHVHVPPSSLRGRCPDLPAGLDELVLRLLAKDPGERPQDAREVRQELQELRSALPVSAPGAGHVPRPHPAHPIHSAATTPPPKPSGASEPDRAPPGRSRRHWSSTFRGLSSRRRATVVGAAVGVLVASLLTAFLLWPSGSGPSSPTPRVIAVVGDFTGAGKVKAQAAFNGVRLALTHTRGITARKFNNTGTAAGSQHVAEQIVADETIAAVIAPVGDSPSNVMEQASRTYAQHDIVMISPWTRLTGDLGSTTYHVMGKTGVMEQATIDFLTNLAYAKIDVDGATYFSDGTPHAAATAGRISSATRDVYPSHTRTVGEDVNQLAEDVRESGDNVVFYAGQPKAFQRLDTALGKAHHRGLRLAQDSAMDGVYKVKSSWMATRNSCFRNDQFDTALWNAYGHGPELGAVESYEAALALTAAIEATGSEESGQALRHGVSRSIDDVHPKGLCNTDLRFGRDGYLHNPPTFMDVIAAGTNHPEEIRGIASKGALQRARTLMQ